MVSAKYVYSRRAYFVSVFSYYAIFLAFRYLFVTFPASRTASRPDIAVFRAGYSRSPTTPLHVQA